MDEKLDPIASDLWNLAIVLAGPKRCGRTAHGIPRGDVFSSQANSRIMSGVLPAQSIIRMLREQLDSSRDREVPGGRQNVR